MAAQPSRKSVSSDKEDQRNESKAPAHVVSYYVAKDTYIQASIWERTVENGENSFTVFDVSVRKRLKQDDEWKSVYSFRGSELPFVIRALDRAEGWILETRRKEDGPF